MTSKSAIGVCDSRRHEARAAQLELGQRLLRRQEEALADDVVDVVEELIDRLEAQVGHPDVVGVRERQRDPQPAGVRLGDVADLARQGGAGGVALCGRLLRAQAFQGNTRVPSRTAGRELAVYEPAFGAGSAFAGAAATARPPVVAGGRCARA